MAPRGERDRYEPLPGLLAIPGHLARRLSPRGRRVALVAAAALLVAAAAGLAAGVPAIVRAKREHAAQEQRAAAQARAARLEQLRAELRRIDGRGAPARGLSPAAALTARRAVAADLVAAVQADAAGRARSGEFAHLPTRVECSRYPAAPVPGDPAEDLSRRHGRYACLAVTADVPEQTSTRGGAIGYPYRARVDFASGRFSFCKISGRPGEGSLARTPVVPVPAACGGER
jgi:hypothetical protein